MFGLHLPWRQVRERRAQFRQKRAGREQNDPAFVADAAFEGDEQLAELALMIRRVVADACGLPPTMLRADDQTTELELLFGAATLGNFIMAMPMSLPESMDAAEFFWNLEGAIDERFGDKFQLSEIPENTATTRWLSGEQFGTWVVWLAKEISSHTREQKKSP